MATGERDEVSSRSEGKHASQAADSNLGATVHGVYGGPPGHVNRSYPFLTYSKAQRTHASGVRETHRQQVTVL